MFDVNKIVSNRVLNEVPECIQNLLWYLIETMEVIQKNHVQVFEISGSLQEGLFKQKILHTQQYPIYKKVHIVSAQATVNAKIIVVNDTTFSVMLMS